MEFSSEIHDRIKRMKSFKTFLEDKMSKKHHLGVGVSFSHMKGDALRHIDVDNDGDVDTVEKSAKDELTGEEPMLDTKKILKKLGKEAQQAKKRISFE